MSLGRGTCMALPLLWPLQRLCPARASCLLQGPLLVMAQMDLCPPLPRLCICPKDPLAPQERLLEAGTPRGLWWVRAGGDVRRRPQPRLGSPDQFPAWGASSELPGSCSQAVSQFRAVYTGSGRGLLGTTGRSRQETDPEQSTEVGRATSCCSLSPAPSARVRSGDKRPKC